MKRLILLLLAFHFALAAYPQPKESDIFLGGRLSIYYGADKTGDEEGSASVNIRISPEIGYFVGSRNALGAGLGLELNGTVYTNESSLAQRYYSLNVFHRYYFVAGTGGLFMESTIFTRFGKFVSDVGGNITTENNINIGISESLGVYYFIVPSIAIEGQLTWLGFDYFKEEDEINITTGLNFHPNSLSFGMIFVF